MSTAIAELKPGTEVEMKFAWIPPGRFLRGSSVNHSEKPVHRVSITEGFWMGIVPVTQFQFEAVLGYNLSTFRGLDRPVDNVSWFDAQEFCKEFGKLTSRAIRLPTEAEWEYACRAGTTSDYWTGYNFDDLKCAGWYDCNSNRQTQPVGKLAKNPWGLYDVHGNVAEWCQDWYRGYYTAEDQTDPQGQPDGDERVTRGGSWYAAAEFCRAAVRRGHVPSYRSDTVGFRVCFHPHASSNIGG